MDNLLTKAAGGTILLCIPRTPPKPTKVNVCWWKSLDTANLYQPIGVLFIGHYLSLQTLGTNIIYKTCPVKIN